MGAEKRIKLLKCSLQCVLYSDICENINHVNIESECVLVYMYIKMDASASFIHFTVYNTGTARGSCSLWKQYKLVVFFTGEIAFLSPAMTCVAPRTQDETRQKKKRQLDSQMRQGKQLQGVTARMRNCKLRWEKRLLRRQEVKFFWNVLCF